MMMDFRVSAAWPAASLSQIICEVEGNALNANTGALKPAYWILIEAGREQRDDGRVVRGARAAA